MHKFALVLVLCAIAFAQKVTFQYDATVARGNPLRGYVGYMGMGSTENSRFPNSMEYSYFGLADMMKGENTFDWTVLENALNYVKSVNKQLVMRPYISYPEDSTSMPTYLTTNCGSTCVKMIDYTDYGGGKIPDWTNPRMTTAMTNFIAALGAKYDGDVRLALVQVGFLGYWGEWHTYPSENLMASTSVMASVMNAYQSAFKITPCHVSIDAITYSGFTYNYPTIGVHSDDYKEDSCTADFLIADRLKQGGKTELWKTAVIGGEVYPDSQTTVFNTAAKGNAMVSCNQQSHLTWLLYDTLFTSSSLAGRDTYGLQSDRNLGYQFHLLSLSVVNGNLVAEVNNTGVAPFYYNLYVAAAVGGKTFTSSANLKGQLPGVIVSYTIPVTGVSGSASVAVSLSCANVLRPIKWATSTTDSKGALTTTMNFGSGSVTPTTVAPTPAPTPAPTTPAPQPSTTMETDRYDTFPLLKGSSVQIVPAKFLLLIALVSLLFF